MKLNAPLLALAAGAFGIGVTEFAPMALLPVIAADLGVSIPAAGLLVSAYALGVVLGAPLMILTTGRVPRRTLLIGLVAIFTVGNLLSAMSGSYELLIVARVITSLNHGAFFGVGSIVAASLVPKGKQAGAVAAMFTGLTIAIVLGMPLTTWIGGAVGWRGAFWGMTAIGVFVMAALRLTLPSIPAPTGGNVLAELRVLARGSVLAALALTTIGFSAMFTVFTYIVPILRDQAGHSSRGVAILLAISGLGMTLGNWLGGKFADRSVERTLVVSLGALALLLTIFGFVMGHAGVGGIVLFLWSTAAFALAPPLQMRVMTAASDAPNLSSAMNIGAFNLANAIGAAVGAAVIAGGWGLPATAYAGAVAAALGLTFMLSLQRRHTSRGEQRFDASEGVLKPRVHQRLP